MTHTASPTGYRSGTAASGPRNATKLLAALILAAAAMLSLGQPAHARIAPPDVPDVLQVRDGSSVYLVGHAVGVQIYTCTASSGGYSWTLVAPRADLYGDNGKLIATHFAGPTWQATDSSSVKGQRVAGVTVHADAIPWLLLSATSMPGPDGDRLVGTTFIQRVATTGGLPPAADTCDATSVGAVAEVPYTADYYFWK